MLPSNISRNLKPVDLRIAEQYVITGNGTQSVMYVFPEKSYTASRKYFHRLSQKPEFLAYIHQASYSAAERLEITTEYVLKTLKRWLDSDITNTLGLSEEDIKLLPIEERRLIKTYKKYTYSYKGKTTETLEVQYVSKEKAMLLLVKHLGLFSTSPKPNDKEVDIKVSFTRVPK